MQIVLTKVNYLWKGLNTLVVGTKRSSPVGCPGLAIII